MANIKVKNNYIKYQMKEKGISHADLAKLLECSEQNLYKTLSKDTVPTFTDRLIKICFFLNLSPLDVFEIEE